MDVYAENILDHYRQPRFKRKLNDATVDHGEVNHSCGDAVNVMLRLENNRLVDLGWTGEGCAISQAGVSMLCEEIEGMTIEDVLDLTKQDVYDMFGVPIGMRRYKCALIGLHAVKNAIRKAKELKPQGWLDTVELAE